MILVLAIAPWLVDRIGSNESYSKTQERSNAGERHPMSNSRRKRLDSLDSCSSYISTVRPNQDSHHFLERSYVELWHRFCVLQPVPHR